jgi:myo-inositol-1(or 4)-monophosphatase
MLGVASLNLLGVGLGTMLAALEATPKVWDIAAVWLMLQELQCPLRSIAAPPFPLTKGSAEADASYPTLAACNQEQLERFMPWANQLV